MSLYICYFSIVKAQGPHSESLYPGPRIWCDTPGHVANLLGGWRVLEESGSVLQQPGPEERERGHAAANPRGPQMEGASGRGQKEEYTVDGCRGVTRGRKVGLSYQGPRWRGPSNFSY